MTFHKPQRRVNRVFLHCTASDANLRGRKLLAEVNRWHRERGFTGIGYHFLIDDAGEVLTGRDLERTPAAQYGHNKDTIAICTHGLKTFPDVALQATKALCAEINAAYKGRVTFHGHCEVAAKTCPVYPYRELLGLDAAGKMPLTQEK